MAVCLRAIDEGLPAPCAQLLTYPAMGQIALRANQAGTASKKNTGRNIFYEGSRIDLYYRKEDTSYAKEPVFS